MVSWGSVDLSPWTERLFVEQRRLWPVWLAAALGTGAALYFALPMLGIAMAWLINFTVHVLVGLIAFWSDNALGYDTVVYQLYIMLGGVVIPVELFPKAVQSILAWTPFPYVLDFPVRVMDQFSSSSSRFTRFGSRTSTSACLICSSVKALASLGKATASRNLPSGR